MVAAYALQPFCLRRRRLRLIPATRARIPIYAVRAWCLAKVPARRLLTASKTTRYFYRRLLKMPRLPLAT